MSKQFPLDTTSSIPDQQRGVIRREETAADVMVRVRTTGTEWSSRRTISAADLAALRADAARWRWWMCRCEDDNESAWNHAYEKFCESIGRDEIERKVDAAIAAEKGAN